MWKQPYLETCCRSALHRLALADAAGRPTTETDAPCLRRLIGMGLVELRPDERAHLLPAGRDRHATEIAARRR
jgi:hypothetical protein